MGVWQVTEDTQPYIGQWDATTDSFWDGSLWSSHNEAYNRYGNVIGMGGSEEIQKPVINTGNNLKFIWYGGKYADNFWWDDKKVNKTPTPEELSANKAEAAWAALESMF